MLDVGQGAHGELQAAGQIGAVAVAQRYSSAHDVVAEPCQVSSVHEGIMTHQNGNVEPPCPFGSVYRTNSEKLFPWHSGQLGPGLGDRVPEQFLHLLLGSPDHLDLGYPGQFPAHHRGLGQCVAGPPLLADGEVVEPFALVGVPQRTAPLG